MARYKYSPHWVDFEKMYEAINTLGDNETPRGLMLIIKSGEIDEDFYSRKSNTNRTQVNIRNSIDDAKKFKNHLGKSDCDKKIEDLSFENEEAHFFFHLSTMFLIIYELQIKNHDVVKKYYKGK